jgi:hypothetical protein
VHDPGNFAENPAGEDIGFELFVETGAEQSAPDGQVGLRAVHGATDAPTVDIDENGTTLFDNLTYGDVTPDYLDAAAEMKRLVVTPGESEESVASFQADLSALGGSAATVLASGFLDPAANQDGPGFALVAARPNGDVVVFSQNQAPQFAEVPGDTTVTAEEELSETVDAEDPDGDEVTFALTEAPEGAAIDSASGDFTWTPTQAQADSTYEVGVRASDGAASSDTSFAVTVEPGPIDFDITRDFGDASVQANYELVALPGDVDIDLVDGAGSGFSGEQGSNWRAFRELGAANGADAELEAYDGSDAFNFREGRAFWVISQNQFSIQGTVPPTQMSAIDLQGGWNAISNPLRSGLDWSSLQDANGLDEALFRYNGGWEQVDSLNSAQTGEGYYVFNSAELDSLSLTDEASGNALAANEGDSKTVSLTVRDGGKEGSSITAGAGSEVSTHRAPPTHFSSPKTTLRILGSDSENRYVRMVRPVDGESTTFSLVLSGEENERVTIEASGLGAEGPEGAVLVEEATGQSQNLRETSIVTVQTGDDGEARLTLHVGSSEVNEVAAPDKTELRGNYPNPFSRQTTFELALSEQVNVEIEVYNVLGQQVATVADGEMDPGTHKLDWDESSLSSGTYFVRMKAGSETDVHKITVVR